MTGRPAVGRAGTLVSVLRLAALALVIVGFLGWVIDHDGTVVLESPYTVAFGAGVACALASIYLGIFLANGGSEAETDG